MGSLGWQGGAGGAPRRQMTRRRCPKAQKWAPFWDTFEGWRHHLPECFFRYFPGALFIACGAFYDDCWRCFGRHLGSLGPLKIMPKCTTICIFMLWTLLVRTLFRDLLWEGVWHAFFKIWVPIGAPIETPFCHFWQLFQGLILEAVFGRHRGVKTLRNGWGRRLGRGLLACFCQILELILHAWRHPGGMGRRICRGWYH